MPESCTISASHLHRNLLPSSHARPFMSTVLLNYEQDLPARPRSGPNFRSVIEPSGNYSVTEQDSTVVVHRERAA